MTRCSQESDYSSCLERDAWDRLRREALDRTPLLPDLTAWFAKSYTEPVAYKLKELWQLGNNYNATVMDTAEDGKVSEATLLTFKGGFGSKYFGYGTMRIHDPLDGRLLFKIRRT